MRKMRRSNETMIKYRRIKNWTKEAENVKKEETKGEKIKKLKKRNKERKK